jgi:hypothetical protein
VATAERERERERYQTDPEYRARKKAATSRRSKERYHADLVAARAAARAKQARRAEQATPEQRERRHQREVERYERRRDDPEYLTQKALRDALRPRQPLTGADLERIALRRPEKTERERRADAFTRARTVGSRRRRWTPDEDREVMRTDLTVIEVALQLNRTRVAVVTRRRDLRRDYLAGRATTYYLAAPIVRREPRWPRWTPAQDSIALDPSLSLREAAARTGRTLGAVGVRRHHLRRAA